MVPFAGLSRKDIQNVKVDQLIYTDGRPYQIKEHTRRQTLVNIVNTAILFIFCLVVLTRLSLKICSQ